MGSVSTIGETATGFFDFFPAPRDFDDAPGEAAFGEVIVTVGVMYDGTFDDSVDGFVGPTGELVVDFAVEVVEVLFVLLLVSFAVPASDDNDAFIAATGATGTAMNGTAVIAAMVHATVTCTVRRDRRFIASKNRVGASIATRSDAGAGLPQDMCFTVRPPWSRVVWVRREDDDATPRHGESTDGEMDKNFRIWAKNSRNFLERKGFRPHPSTYRRTNPQPKSQVDVEVSHLRAKLRDSRKDQPSTIVESVQTTHNCTLHAHTWPRFKESKVFGFKSRQNERPSHCPTAGITID